MDRVAADQASRRLAQSEFERSVVVVAGAGTGKTALLVSRVVVWCVGPGWDRHAADDVDRHSVARRVIERVVAITFTEAAAAEMARKIGTALIDLAGGESPIGWDPEPGLLPDEEDEVRARARALSEESHRLVVSTIHAFCQRLLSTYPLEAGLHPRFEVDPEGARLESLAEELVEDRLRGLADDPNRPSWERLAVEGKGPPEVVSAHLRSRRCRRRPGGLRGGPVRRHGRPGDRRKASNRSQRFRGRGGSSPRASQGRGEHHHP